VSEGSTQNTQPQDQPAPATAERELPHSVADDAELTEGQRAEAADVIESIVEIRRNKANRATRGVLAALLCLEAIVVLLVPRAIAQTSTGLDGTKTGILIALAVVLVATGFLLKRPWGIGLGTALQVAVVVTGVLTLVMLFIGLIFVAIWLWVLTMRRDLVGTPGGLRMLVS
jgi:hypothetical protein